MCPFYVTKHEFNSYVSAKKLKNLTYSLRFLEHFIILLDFKKIVLVFVKCISLTTNHKFTKFHRFIQISYEI
jgi:hypothetical protein